MLALISIYQPRCLGISVRWSHSVRYSICIPSIISRWIQQTSEKFDDFSRKFGSLINMEQKWMNTKFPFFGLSPIGYIPSTKVGRVVHS